MNTLDLIGSLKREIGQNTNSKKHIEKQVKELIGNLDSRGLPSFIQLANLKAQSEAYESKIKYASWLINQLNSLDHENNS